MSIVRNHLLYVIKEFRKNIRYIHNFEHVSFLKKKTNMFFKPLNLLINLFISNNKDNVIVIELTTREKYNYILTRKRQTKEKVDNSNIFDSLDDRSSYLGVDIEKIQQTRLRFA